MSVEAIRHYRDENHPYHPDLLPAIPLLGQVEILGVREGGLVECYVPTDLIDHEEVPVKEEWASEIARLMSDRAERKGGSGQKTPIQAGWIEGEPKFRIIDGFHRDAALVINGEPKIYCTVELTDWNSLYDDRIATAKDHAHVRFSRVVQWIRDVWQHSGLSENMTVEQAVLLYRFDTDGSKSGHSPESVTAAKAWVARKEQQWGMAAMTFHSYLKVAENVDPMLVHSTRDKKGGHTLEAPTQTIIKALSEYLPGEENFGLQNIVVTKAIERNLTSPLVKALCLGVQEMDVESAQVFVESIDWENWQPEYSDSKNRALRRAHDPRYKGAMVLNDVSRGIEQIKSRVAQSLDREEEVTGEMSIRLNEAIIRVQRLHGELGELSLYLSRLATGQEPDKKAVKDTALLAAQSIIRKSSPSSNGDKKAPNTSSSPASERSAEISLHRERYGRLELPDFGVFTDEDWSAFEPHIRFALSLNHKRITEGTFADSRELLDEIIAIAKLEQVRTESYGGETPKLSRAQIARLTPPQCEVNYITLDKETKKLVITEAGQKYLTQAVQRVLSKVDK